MTGITGWVSYDSDLTNERAAIDAMTNTISGQRSDADSGTWVRRQVALGYRRMSVVNYPIRTEPMTVHTSNGEIALVFDGALCNLVELRRDLEARGHRFKTNGDAEVVLHGYLEWGESVAEHLNGGYGFAIWDARFARLSLIRDRMGIRPLYYYPIRDGALFGTEPKGIVANTLAPKVIDVNGLRGLLPFTSPPSCLLWKGMYQVQQGTIVTVDSTGTRSRAYWTLPCIPHNDDQETTVAKVRELLTDSVHRQLVADGPSCTLLSGGLDSSALTGLAASRVAERGEQLHTFSVDFPEYEQRFAPSDLHDSPDAPYVRDVVDLVGSEHRNVVLGAAELADPAVRRALITAWDIPGGWGDVGASLYLLCKEIRAHSTAALSGLGADLLFGGPPGFHREVDHTDIVTILTTQSSRTIWTDMFRADVWKLLDIRRYSADRWATAAAKVEHLDRASDIERRMRTFYNLQLTQKGPVTLERTIRAALAVDLDVRTPFWDHRLVEYVYNVPWSLKTFDGREKSLLRNAMKDVLPPSVAERAKSGYPSTQDPEYAALLLQHAKEILAKRASPVFSLVNRNWLKEAVQSNPARMAMDLRFGIDWTIDLHHWFEMYRPELVLD